LLDEKNEDDFSKADDKNVPSLIKEEEISNDNNELDDEDAKGSVK
jgi:hypothetical protein